MGEQSNDIVCEPAADYESLRKQFLALRQLANSMSAQNSYLRKRDDRDMRAATTEQNKQNNKGE